MRRKLRCELYVLCGKVAAMRVHHLNCATMCPYSSRLINGVGGLFSPGMLRLCGTLMMVGPWLWVILDLTDYWRWGHLVSFTTAGIACWILAARRERRDAADPTISVPNNEPLN